MPSLHRLALKLQARVTHWAYAQRERRMAQPASGARALAVLFSRRDAWETPIRAGFLGLPHRLTFDELTLADLERFDLIVPLSLDDARFLRDQPAHVRERCLPLPDAACSELCHDKPALNRHLAAAGFDAHIPAMGDELAPPYVSKPARGENSDDCVLVADRADEHRLGAVLNQSGRFRQSAVAGSIEYATHFLMRDGAIERELTVAYHHEQALFIKGQRGAPPALRVLGRCTDPLTLTGMLRSIGYEGIGCANYKLQDGRLQLLEINPRMGGSLGEHFYSFLRSLPQSRRTRARGCTNWTWLDSVVERESLAL
jgi:hypothetical protein